MNEKERLWALDVYRAYEDAYRYWRSYNNSAKNIPYGLLCRKMRDRVGPVSVQKLKEVIEYVERGVMPPAGAAAARRAAFNGAVRDLQRLDDRAAFLEREGYDPRGQLPAVIAQRAALYARLIDLSKDLEEEEVEEALATARRAAQREELEFELTGTQPPPGAT